MQETRFFEPAGPRLRQEFFVGEAAAEIARKMDARLAALKGEGHTLVRRVKIGRNAQCPCGSGLKFKKCCIGKAT